MRCSSFALLFVFLLALFGDSIAQNTDEFFVSGNRKAKAGDYTGAIADYNKA